MSVFHNDPGIYTSGDEDMNGLNDKEKTARRQAKKRFLDTRARVNVLVHQNFLVVLDDLKKTGDYEPLSANVLKCNNPASSYCHF